MEHLLCTTLTLKPSLKISKHLLQELYIPVDPRGERSIYVTNLTSYGSQGGIPAEGSKVAARVPISEGR